MKCRSCPIPVILAILREITQKFANLSLKFTQNRENCHLWISWIPQIVKREITFSLDSHKFWSRNSNTLSILLLQFNDGNCGVRLRYDPLSSELVEGKMVLKIVKPPRNKDSLSSLTAQSFSWIFNVSSPNSVKN